MAEGEDGGSVARDIRNRIGAATSDTGQATLRSLLLINGGAAVAMLAFLGALAGKCDMKHVALLAVTIKWFAYGVALAVASMGATYGTNFSQSMLLRYMKSKSEPPYVERSDGGRGWRFSAITLMVCAFGLGVGSLVLFLYGMYFIQAGVVSLSDAKCTLGN
jgi:hypothetical protein